jgi:hypothetical protein
MAVATAFAHGGFAGICYLRGSRLAHPFVLKGLILLLVLDVPAGLFSLLPSSWLPSCPPQKGAAALPLVLVNPGASTPFLRIEAEDTFSSVGCFLWIASIVDAVTLADRKLERVVRWITAKRSTQR